MAKAVGVKFGFRYVITTDTPDPKQTARLVESTRRRLERELQLATHRGNLTLEVVEVTE